MTFSEIANQYKYEPFDKVTAFAIEKALKAQFPGNYTVVADDNKIFIEPSSPEEATWLSLIW